MPKVKKKAAAKKRVVRRAPAKRSPGMLAGIGEKFGRFAPIVGAGLVVAFVFAGVIFWSGGYFGLLAEKTNRIAGNGVVAVGFEVRRITARGVDETSEQELLGAIGPVIGDSILHFDPHAARGRVEELGWVRSAAISRLLPGTVHVSIREREPAAIWQLSGMLHLIDEHGAVIRQIGDDEYLDMPLIVGAGAPEASAGMLAALKAHPVLGDQISALVRVSDRRWNLRLYNGIDIKFPEKNYQRAVDEITALHIAHGILDEPFEYIDLRDPERVVFKRRGEVEEQTGALSPDITGKRT